VEAAAPVAPAGHGDIDTGERGRAALELALAAFDGTLELALQRVGLSAHALARLRIEAGEGLQDFSESASLAPQELNFQLLEPAFVGARDLVETLPQRL